MTASVDTPRPGPLPLTGSQPAAGSAPAGHALPDVDRRIGLAFGELGRARRRFAEHPSGESVTACVAAEETINELLDLRLTLTAQPALLR